ncbi:MAG: sn-glycerol-3-phosphate ABC transporter ATP-binding protein UgpC [Elusimicrobia bacterium]|nr:sn-glycerol-3-phosphate ABC transporter ATP-binding protein UgpC [Elusimicrobiota bacterium]
MARVILKNLTKSFGDHPIVNNVSLDIPDKEFFILVGPSGCGKSTTLRMIAGLEELTSGEIHINGRMVNHVRPKDRDIAMVFQNYALYPHMSVYENMAFGLKLRGYSRAEIDRRVREAADILTLGPYLDRKPRALSGGQRQRVAVGRAIVRKPQVFLFDEPLSNLDAKLRVQMRLELSKLHERLQTTIVYVTHDQVEAMTMGDRICVMKDGEVQQVAPPLELYQHPANQFVAGFIGNPPMNFFPVIVETGRGGPVLRHASFNLTVPKTLADQARPLVGREVNFGIRPEDLYDRLFYNYPVSDGSSVKAVVDVVEPMGSEIYLYLRAGTVDLVVRVPAYVKAEAGRTMDLVFNLEQMHLFDRGTGQSLLKPIAAPALPPRPTAAASALP